MKRNSPSIELVGKMWKKKPTNGLAISALEVGETIKDLQKYLSHELVKGNSCFVSEQLHKVLWKTFEKHLKQLSDYDVCHLCLALFAKFYATGMTPNRKAAINRLQKELNP